MQQHQVQVHSGHLGRYPQDPGAGSSLGHLHSTTELVHVQSSLVLTHEIAEKMARNTPFFLEGESLCWLLEGVEVATLDGRTSRGSVGVIGLIEVMVLTDVRGFTGVTVVIGVRGLGLTMVHTEDEAPSSFSTSVSFSMASELRMTRKWVLSDGVMVTVFSSSAFSFLVTWILNIRGKS